MGVGLQDMDLLVKQVHVSLKLLQDWIYDNPVLNFNFTILRRGHIDIINGLTARNAHMIQ
jgi:hypothetical protein